jgi:hypothetical protein
MPGKSEGIASISSCPLVLTEGVRSVKALLLDGATCACLHNSTHDMRVTGVTCVTIMRKGPRQIA